MHLQGAVFHQEQLHWLSKEAFNALLSQGSAPFIADGVAPNAQLGLAIDSTVSNFFFEFEPEKDLGLFLHNSRLVRCCSTPPPQFGLADVWTLETVLLDQFKSVEKTPIQIVGMASKWNDWLKDEPEPQLLESIRESRDFMGMAARCGCGEAGCSAEYVWLKGNLCLMYLRIVAVGVREVRFFPFRVGN